MRFAVVGHGGPAAAALRGLLEGGVRPEVVFVGHPPAAPNELGVAADELQIEAVDVSIGDDAALASGLESRGVDAVVVCGWPRRISPELLVVPHRGWINCHPSWLPLWKGFDPVGWGMVAGDRHAGITVHEMNVRFDEGRRLGRRAVLLPEGVNRVEAYRLLCTQLGTLAAEVIERDLEPDPAALSPDAARGTTVPPHGVLALLDPSVLGRHSARQAILAFAPSPGVGVIGVDGLVVGLADDQAPPADATRQEVDFVGGTLGVFVRPFDII